MFLLDIHCRRKHSVNFVPLMPYSTSNNPDFKVTQIFDVRSRSLKMAPFDRPCATFYWSAIETIALSCTIFAFDRSHTTFYWSTIVNIALSYTVFELFDVKKYRELEI